MSGKRVKRCAELIPACIVLTLFGGSVRGDGDPANFELNLQVEKSLYLLAEPIWVDVRLTYTGPDTIVLSSDPLCLECETLEVQVRSGERVFPYTGIVPMWIPTRRAVAPGEVIEESFDLTIQFGEPIEGTFLMEKELPVGAYDVSARELGVESQTVSFTIIEPTGHDAVIYKAMHDAIVLKLRRRQSDASAELEALLPTTADSPYRDKLFYLTARVWFPNRMPEHLAACRRIIDVDPDSRYARKTIYRLASNMSEEEVEGLREDLDRRAPGSRAAKAVAEALTKGWIGE